MTIGWSKSHSQQDLVATLHFLEEMAQLTRFYSEEVLWCGENFSKSTKWMQSWCCKGNFSYLWSFAFIHISHPTRVLFSQERLGLGVSGWRFPPFGPEASAPIYSWPVSRFMTWGKSQQIPCAATSSGSESVRPAWCVWRLTDDRAIYFVLGPSIKDDQTDWGWEKELSDFVHKQ